MAATAVFFCHNLRFPTATSPVQPQVSTDFSDILSFMAVIYILS